MAPIVTTLTPAQQAQIEQDLRGQDFTITTPPHTRFQARRKGLSCTLYLSGKLVIQGEKAAEFIEFYLEPELLKELRFSAPPEVDTTPRMGSDEAGKGDLFGPLVVTALYADEAGIDQLLTMGVMDSKRLADEKALKMAAEIEKKFAHSTVSIGPKKYNELYEKFQNLNHLLAWGHATAIHELHEKTGCNKVLIDQFANERLMENALHRRGLNLDISQAPKMEADVVVAAASIVARARFLKGLKRLVDEFQHGLPKGASNATVEAARSFANQFGPAALVNVSKLHFKSLEGIR